MQFSTNLIILGLASIVSADLGARYLNPNGTNPNFVVKTVTAITIDCPEPTVLTTNDKTYTVTKSGPFVITDCQPCLVTLPVLRPSTRYYTSCPPTTYQHERPTATKAPTVTVNVTPATDIFEMARYTGAANARNVGGFMLGAVGVAAALAL